MNPSRRPHQSSLAPHNNLSMISRLLNIIHMTSTQSLKSTKFFFIARRIIDGEDSVVYIQLSSILSLICFRCTRKELRLLDYMSMLFDRIFPLHLGRFPEMVKKSVYIYILAPGQMEILDTMRSITQCTVIGLHINLSHICRRTR